MNPTPDPVSCRFCQTAVADTLAAIETDWTAWFWNPYLTDLDTPDRPGVYDLEAVCPAFTERHLRFKAEFGEHELR